MSQQNAFQISINPTVLLVAALLLAMLFGNRWRDSTPTISEAPVAEDGSREDRVRDLAAGKRTSSDQTSRPSRSQLAENNQAEKNVAEDGGNQRYGAIVHDDWTEPQRLPYGRLIEDAQPIQLDIDREDKWISPPANARRQRKANYGMAQEPIAPPSSSPFPVAGTHPSGSLVSLPAEQGVGGRDKPSVSLSAPVLSAPVANVQRDGEWSPAPDNRETRPVAMGRLPRLPNSTTSERVEAEQVSTPRGERLVTQRDTFRADAVGSRQEETSVESERATETPYNEEPADEARKRRLPPLIPPQTKLESRQDVDGRPQTASTYPARQEQVELTDEQTTSPSTAIDWEQLAEQERRQLALQASPAPLDPQAVHSSEITATRHLEAAMQFANHRALAAANAELETALRTIAAGADSSNVTPIQVDRLASAMRALKEAEDFLPGSPTVQHGHSAKQIASRHRTEVVSKLERPVAATEAVELYFVYAQQAMLHAVGHSRLSSAVLYQLGKVYTESQGTSVVVTRAPAARATLFHETALRIDPANYLAANELAVLLAKAGQWERAKRYLLHSLSIQPLPEAWYNLAKVHDQLGEAGLAARARREYELMSGVTSAPSQAAVQWVRPEQFETAAAPVPPPKTPTATPPSGAPTNTLPTSPYTTPQYTTPQYTTPHYTTPPAPSNRVGGTRWSPRGSTR